jgi:hypothetical protein
LVTTILDIFRRIINKETTLEYGWPIRHSARVLSEHLDTLDKDTLAALKLSQLTLLDLANMHAEAEGRSGFSDFDYANVEIHPTLEAHFDNCVNSPLGLTFPLYERGGVVREAAEIGVHPVDYLQQLNKYVLDNNILAPWQVYRHELLWLQEQLFQHEDSGNAVLPGHHQDVSDAIGVTVRMTKAGSDERFTFGADTFMSLACRDGC